MKVSIGKLVLHAPFAELFPGQLTANRIQLVAVDSVHAEKVAIMPLHHRDPFDRLIVAQGLIEQMTVVSADEALDAYGGSRL